MTKKIKLKDPVAEAMRVNYKYTGQSIDEALAHAREVERNPLNERKEARESFQEAMATDPALVAERIGWLIDGNYGYGEMLKAKQVVAHTRMNRKAALTHMVGLYEWQCPGKFAADAWNKLTGAQKQALDAAVNVVIEAAEQEMAEEQGA